MVILSLARDSRLYHVQGVEFYQLGEGGKIGHYPVHFHLARKTAVTNNPTPNQIAYVKDSSVWDSMTRWYVIHGTQDITLARNVGYESIGHGYYLEDATEINNKLYSNLGVLARAAVINAQNPRQVPGILAAHYPSQLTPLNRIINRATGIRPLPFRHRSSERVLDDQRVERFRIQHGGWRHLIAACATGWCRHLIAVHRARSIWTSYAAEQSSLDRAATAPLEKFLGNYCFSAMNSFQTVGNTGSVRESRSPRARSRPEDQTLTRPGWFLYTMTLKASQAAYRSYPRLSKPAVPY